MRIRKTDLLEMDLCLAARKAHLQQSGIDSELAFLLFDDPPNLLNLTHVMIAESGSASAEI
jgi:hypothetical protein